MASLYNADLKPIGPGVKTRPYDHATKLFVADSLRLAPKQSFLYYVVLNVNQSVAAGLYSMLGASTSSVSSQSIFEQYEAGLMVKRIDLPKFSIANKTYNAYNRKNVVVNGISYDPITATFHDDAADVVNKFWNDYYTYYYRDSDYNQELYNVPHKYQPRLRSKWGFTPLNRQIIPFLRDIQIFSLHNKRFTEYKLINPVITSWRHGVHDSLSNNETMTNSMTVHYETVKYRVGTVNPVDVNGFSLLHYDTTPSPISTSTTNIYSNAGLIGAVTSAGSQDLARPDGQGSGKGLLGSALEAYNLYNNAKNINLKSVAGLTIGQLSTGALNGALNTSLTGQVFPTLGGTAGYSALSSSAVAQTSLVANSPYPNSIIEQLDGATTSVLGSARNIGNPVAVAAQSRVEQGIDTATTQASPFGLMAASISGLVPNIPFNASTGQTNVGSNQVLTLGNDGTFTAQRIRLSQNGFNPSDVGMNEAKAPITFNDGSGYPVTLRSYQDGSQVAFDSNNNVLYTIPPGSSPYTLKQLDQINTNAMRSLDVNTETGTRFIVNPQTGIKTAVGGTTAQISNSLSQSLGAASGVLAGQQVYSALARTGLGKSLVGQVFAGAVGTATTGTVYKLTNNLLQPIVNTGVGAIGQAFDSISKSIKNIGATWTETGGYIASKPYDNLAYTEYEPGGGVRYTYQNGETLYEDPTGNIVRSSATAGGAQLPAPITDANFNSAELDIQQQLYGLGPTFGLDYGYE